MAELSRRNLLKGAGATLLAGMAWNQVMGQVAPRVNPEGDTPIALSRLTLGDFKLTVIKDNNFPIEPNAFAIGAPEGAVQQVLASNNLSTDIISTSVNIMLLETPRQRILFDSGTGANLLASLELLGVMPRDIDHVIISHYHFDHTDGLVRDDAPTFPNAQVHVAQSEWDFVRAASDNEGAQKAYQIFQMMDSAGMLELYRDEQEIITGIQAVAAPGHTAGHHAFILNSQGKQLMCSADTCNNFLVALQQPGWGFGFDADVAQATATRRTIFGRAADEGMQIFAYHFPFPGVGYVVREGYGFRFIPNT